MKRIVLKLDYCIGCRSCEAACRSRFKVEARIRHGEATTDALLPQGCRHCDEPLCAAACPFQVIVRNPDTGVVRKSDFHCVGCRSCALACPFGVIPPSLARHMSQKCTLCSDRPEGPRCVQTCPTGALQFIEEEEQAGKKAGAGFAVRSVHGRRLQ
ncbi:4Fe-4S dicluster domain-containing protein [candidate division WOR-3 bacterium]|uniref:4Fe-4S dicluster domain-containing protein n=1 Tax=candidate division WOR-3 bacterium TaxID=2052148 RepID=A0A938BTZ8_UNCW3|nr:4Fe-4S dicluster domain-containing protein [candidate division WOR-3 bacterium]